MTPEQVQSWELPFRRELRRFGFTERERIVAETVADLTLAHGRLLVRIPRLAWLSDLVAIDRGNLSRVLRSLARARVVSVTWSEGELLLRPLVDSSTWSERQVSDRETVEAAARRIAAHNAIEQLEIFPDGPDLEEAIAEASILPLPTVSEAPKSTPEDRCQIGNVANLATLTLPGPLPNWQRPNRSLADNDLPKVEPAKTSVGMPAANACMHALACTSGKVHAKGMSMHGGSPAPAAAAPLDREHDVGELSRRTTEDLLADIRKLLPGLAGIHLAQWQARIEREAADVVNGVIRKAQRARREGRPIRNLAGWMNRAYLGAMRDREEPALAAEVDPHPPGVKESPGREKLAGSAGAASDFSCADVSGSLHKSTPCERPLVADLLKSLRAAVDNVSPNEHNPTH